MSTKTNALHSLEFETAEVAWDIKEYPAVEVLYDSRLQYEGALHFTNKTPGLVELSTSVDDFNTGETHDLMFECDINVEQLQPHLDDTGTFHIGPLQPSNGGAENSGHYVSGMACNLAE